MLPPNLRNELLSRVSPGKSYTPVVRRAVEHCFDFIDAVASQRRSLGSDPLLDQEARRDELGRIVRHDLLSPLAAALEPVGKLRAFIESQRDRHGQFTHDAAESRDDVSAVEAALFFAKRELGNHATDVSGYDLDALLEPARGA